MRRTARTYAAAAVCAVAVLTIAGCGGSSDDDTPDTGDAAPTTVDRLTLPDPIVNLDTFLDDMASAGGCSDELVDGVTKIVAFAGGAVTSSESGSDTVDIPTCTFSIDPKSTKLVPTIVVGGVPANQNSIVSSSTPPSTMSRAEAPIIVGDDLVGNSVRVIVEKNIAETGYDPRKDSIAGSDVNAGKDINIEVGTVAVRGATTGVGGTQQVPGYYIVAENPNNTGRAMGNLNPMLYIDEWFQRDLTETSFN